MQLTAMVKQAPTHRPCSSAVGSGAWSTRTRGSTCRERLSKTKASAYNSRCQQYALYCFTSLLKSCHTSKEFADGNVTKPSVVKIVMTCRNPILHYSSSETGKFHSKKSLEALGYRCIGRMAPAYVSWVVCSPNEMDL